MQAASTGTCTTIAFGPAGARLCPMSKAPFRPGTAPSDNPADPFKKALAEATKTLADDSDLAVTYSVDPPGRTNDSLRLPQVSRRMTRDEVLLARGTADAFALRHRHHDAAVGARYMPQGNMARELYEAMETARCEAVGARDMPGTAGNIDAKIGAEAARKGYADITDKGQAPLSAAAGYWIRQMATGRDLPKGAANVLDLWRGFIDEQTGDRAGALDDVLADQKAFARLARQLIEDLGYGDQLGEDPDREDEEQEEESETEEEDAPDSTARTRARRMPRPPPRRVRTSRTTRPRRRSRWTTWPIRRPGEEAEVPDSDEAMDPAAPAARLRRRS